MDNIEINQFFDGLMTPTFISDETFEELTAPRRNEEDNNVIDWCDLPLDIIYQVKFLIPVRAKYGNKVLLVLKSKEGTEIKVYSPTNVSKELKICMKSAKSAAYINSVGEKVGRTSSGRRTRYYDFESAYV